MGGQLNQKSFKLTVAILTAVNAITGLWLLIEYLIFVEPEYRDLLWITLIAIQIGLLVTTVFLLYKVSIISALYATIGVILTELAMRIPMTFEEIAANPDVPNIGWAMVPVIGLVAIDWEWESSFILFQYWFVDLAFIGTLISFVLLLLLLVQKNKVKQTVPEAEKSCPSCSADGQSGNFCSKCGAKI